MYDNEHKSEFKMKNDKRNPDLETCRTFKQIKVVETRQR